MISLIYMESKKIKQTSEYNKKERDSHRQRVSQWLPAEREREKPRQAQGIKRYKLL